MNETCTKLFEDKNFINVPLDCIFDKPLSEHLELAVKAYDVYAKNKFGSDWDTYKVMQKKGAKIIISNSLFEVNELTITLTNGYNPYK